MPMIEISGLGKYYGPAKDKPSPLASLPVIGRFFAPAKGSGAKLKNAGLWALRDFSLGIEEGEVLGVIGQNGAGKSTLLKVLARVTPPTTGVVRGRGQVASLLELGLGFQPELTGRENISLYSSLYGIPQARMNDRFDAITQFADLGPAIDKPLRTYSSGMYLRLAFSVAANLEPDILLADEVLAVGDLAFQERCFARVNELSREGRTVLFVSHDMAAIQRICTRTLWLHRGELRMIGPTHDVVGAYEDFMFAGGGEVKQEHGILAQDDRVSLVSVRLVSEAEEEIGALRLGDDAILELTIATKRDGLSVYVGVDAMINVGPRIHLFRVLQPPFTAPRRGAYSVRCRVPAGTFSDHHYKMSLAVVTTVDGVDQAIIAPNSFAFRTYDLGTGLENTRYDGQEGRRKGLVTPEVAWSVSRAPLSTPVERILDSRMSG